MRRILFGTSTLVLGLAALMWTTAPVSGGKGKGGGHGGGGRAPAHVGSVRYVARPAPARAAPARPAPAARTGSVRSEHYAPSRSGGGRAGGGSGGGGAGGGYGGGGAGGGYRNPYRDDYFRRFRPGYFPFLFDDAQYYGYYDLPVGYQTVVEDGITYYLFDGIYYRAYIIDGQTVYLVVPDQ